MKTQHDARVTAKRSRSAARRALFALPLLTTTFATALPGLAHAAPSWPTKGLRPVAVYQFESTVDVTSSGGQPARTVIRGIAAMAVVDSDTNRVKFASVDVSQTDGTGSQPAAMPADFKASLETSFEVNRGASLTIVVDVNESEEVTNIKRSIAKQIGAMESRATAASNAAAMTASTDGFGRFNSAPTVNVVGSTMVREEHRTETDYDQLVVASDLSPDVSVDRTNVYDNNSGLLVSSDATERIAVDFGELPSNPTGPAAVTTAPGEHVTEQAVSKLTISRSEEWFRVSDMSRSTKETPMNTVVTDQMVMDAKKASAPTLGEALDAITANPDAPASSMGLAATIAGEPAKLDEVAVLLQKGAIADASLPAVTAALVEVGTPEAQAVIANEVLTRTDLSPDQMQSLAITAESVSKAVPELEKSVSALTNAGLGIGTVVPNSRNCNDPEDCLPTGGGGGGSTDLPKIPSLPYVKDWVTTIGNSFLGAEFGAGVSLTADPGPLGTHEYNAEARAHATGLILHQRIPVANGLLKTTVNQATNKRNISANLRVLDRTVYSFSRDVECGVELTGNLYTGTLPFFAVHFRVPVGPVVFEGGASAAGHLTVPWNVAARMCGPEGFASAKIEPTVWVDVRAYGGVSFLSLVAAGIEAVGTIAHTTITPRADLVWKPFVDAKPAARAMLQVNFQPLRLSVKAWLRILWWTRRWTLVNYNSPVYTWLVFNVQTENWARITTPSATLSIAPPVTLPGIGAAISNPPTSVTPTVDVVELAVLSE
jgi:hypothetical protein